MLFIALVVAFLLNASFVRFRTFFRIGYFLPNVTSLVAVAIVFGTVFSNNYGLLNYMLSLLGLNSIEWLNKTWGIQLAISVMVIWRWAGYNAIIYLAGLQSIPTVLYEATKIDGASGIQSFSKSPFPILGPSFSSRSLPRPSAACRSSPNRRCLLAMMAASAAAV